MLFLTISFGNMVMKRIFNFFLKQFIMIDKNIYPKLLVVSNNSFSKSNSNGRTLGSLLNGWPKDRLAQFCISSDGADTEICSNYYCVTDKDVLYSTLKLKGAKRRTLLELKSINANRTKDGFQRHLKTPFNMLARNTMWLLGFWKGKSFNEWIDDFNPDVVMLQNGDSYFMHSLAMYISKRTKAHLTIFNTEGYYFFHQEGYYFHYKDRTWVNKVVEALSFKLYRSTYRRIFRKFMHKQELSIYGNKLLKEDYDKEFGNKGSVVIYTGSSIVFNPKLLSTVPKFSYFGNMGFNRHKALIDFALAINEINPLYCLDVYGFINNDSMRVELEKCKSIKFHGLIPYNEVVKKTKESDFLIHVECQDNDVSESLRYGFSTKIADSISSGKIFILYASPDIACSRYIKDNQAGIFAYDKEDLKERIKRVIADSAYREFILNNAKSVSELNHNLEFNSKKMYESIRSIIDSK